MQNTAINQRIAETEIYVFSKNPETGLFIYSRPLEIEEANAVADSVNKTIKQDYSKAKGLRHGLSVNEAGALCNMNTFKGILANKELVRQSKGSLWFPTIQEGLSLDDAKMLPSRESMDFGLAVYSIGEPNKKLSKYLVSQANRKGYTLPVLASFKSLDLKNEGEEYGATPFIASENGLISGQKAVKLLEGFSYLEESGVQWLYCDGGGGVADWGDLDNFGERCRVGRISGEASAKNLQAMVNSQIESSFSKEKKALEDKFKACLQSTQNILSR